SMRTILAGSAAAWLIADDPALRRHWLGKGEHEGVRLIGRAAELGLHLLLVLEQEAVALERIGRLRQRLKQFGCLRECAFGERKRPAALDPLDRLEIHLGALIIVAACVVRLLGKADADRRLSERAELVDPARPEATGIVDEGRVRAPVVP